MELTIYYPNENGFLDEIKWNHEEIKAEVAEKVKHYASLVYTDDQIKDAKSDRATLNKFVSALEDKRKEVKKQCEAPYKKFEAQMKEITGIVNEAVLAIDTQVKSYEDEQKKKKYEDIVSYFNENANLPSFPELKLEMIFDNKWLNASVKLAAVQKAIEEKIRQIESDIYTISKLPEYSFEATEEYKRTLNLNVAIAEGQRLADIQKRKEEAERLRIEREEAEKVRRQQMEELRIMKQREEELARSNVSQTAEEPVIPFKPDAIPLNEEKKEAISFRVWLTKSEALELKQFFNDRKIMFEPI